jgi:protein-S-isoprenylcysteine O-methyltransferase Ste14
VHTLRISVGVVWVLFWIYWLASARGVKAGKRGISGFPIRLIALVAVIALVRLVGIRTVAIHSLPVAVVGGAVFVCGLGLAVWARRQLGRNWGMPMSRKDEPELVTTGPYRLVRHPIYSGLLLGLLGSALTVSLIGLVVVLAAGAYFYYAARVEETNLADSMPEAYPAYRARTKMLIPYVL